MRAVPGVGSAGRSEPGARARLISLVGLLAASVVSGCGEDAEAVRVIAKQRPTAVGEDFRWNASTAERFGLRAPGGAAPRVAAGPHWETPEGWVELPPRSMRDANFLVAGDERAECYLTVLAGDGGGLAANVNRWRSQMSLAPLSDEGLAALPRVRFLGAEAFQVDFEGSWTGMGGDRSAEDYRLVGLLQFASDAARFLKMVGPKSVLDGELEAFQALAASFHDGASHDHAAQEVPAPAPSFLRWTEPDGWRREAQRPMREVSFQFGEAEAPGECYVSVLGGRAGGELANANRWYEQMGQPPLSEAEFADLPRIPMLGTQGTLVEVTGAYQGMQGPGLPEAALIGVICPLEERAVFVKMVGPMRSVQGERSAFLEFCESLEFGE